MLPREFRFGVEVRNRGWIGTQLLDLLRSHRAALVLVDIAYMPHSADLARELDLVTTDFVYARLIGDRKKIDALTDRLDRIVLDQSQRLERWAELLQRIGGNVKEIFAFANNHYAGHGPATTRQLAAYIRGEARPDEQAPPKLGRLPF